MESRKDLTDSAVRGSEESKESRKALTDSAVMTGRGFERSAEPIFD